MILNAVLTVGWEDDPQHPQSAVTLHRGAAAAMDGYATALGRIVHSAPQPLTIYALERLFRRRVGGYRALRQFVGQLAALSPPFAQGLSPQPPRGRQGEALEAAIAQCRIDVFAYGFLAAACRIQGWLAEVPSFGGPFRAVWPQWQHLLTAFERYEQDGCPLPAELTGQLPCYQAVRELLTHPSGSEEGRLLVMLLTNGPSTRGQLGRDLNGVLPARSSMEGLLACGALQLLPSQEELFVIPKTRLALIAFALHYHWGIDLLGEMRSS